MQCDIIISDFIVNLTGIRNDILKEQGEDIKDVLAEFKKYIGDGELVGYNIKFDVNFINNALANIGSDRLNNKTHDIMRCVKNDRLFLNNYEFENVVKEYGVEEDVKHRALDDAILLYKLSLKVNKFCSVAKIKPLF